MFRFNPFVMSIIIATLSFTAFPVYGQILYTDVEPDEVVKAPESLPFKVYNIDMNHDNKPDFKLQHFAPDPLNAAVEIYSWPDECTEAILCNTYNGRPSALEEGFTISPALSSKQFINTYHGGGNTALFINKAEVLTEEWDTDEDRYVGVLVEVNGNWHVGWIRLNMPADASEFTVKDYAIELTPNTPIQAGDQGNTGIDTPDDPTLLAEIYSTGSAIVVELPASALTSTLDLYTILGSHIGEYPLTAAVNRISMHSVPPGAYVAVVQQGSAVTTKLVAVW